MEVVTTLLLCYGLGAAAFQTYISKVLVSNNPVSPPPTSAFQAAKDMIMTYSSYALEAFISVYTTLLLAYGWSSGFVQAVYPHCFHLWQVIKYGIVNMYYLNSFYNKTVPGSIQQSVIGSIIIVSLWFYIKRNYFKKAKDVNSASVQFNYAPRVTLIQQQNTKYFLSSHHIKDRCEIWHDIKMALGSNNHLNLNTMIDQLYNKLKGSEVRAFLTQLELSQDKIATINQFKNFVLQANNAEDRINHYIESAVQKILASDPIQSIEQFIAFLKFIRMEYYLSVNKGPEYFQSFILLGPLRFIRNKDILMQVIKDSQLDDINELAEHLLSDKSRLNQLFKSNNFKPSKQAELPMTTTSNPQFANQLKVRAKPFYQKQRIKPQNRPNIPALSNPKEENQSNSIKKPAHSIKSTSTSTIASTVGTDYSHNTEMDENGSVKMLNGKPTTREIKHDCVHQFVDKNSQTSFKSKEIVDQVNVIPSNNISQPVKKISTVIDEVMRPNTKSQCNLLAYQTIFKILKVPIKAAQFMKNTFNYSLLLVSNFRHKQKNRWLKFIILWKS